MIKLIIFDFDDTLCLNQKACYDLENSIAMKFGFPPIEMAVHQSTWGKPLAEVIGERIPGIDIDGFLKELKIQLPIWAEQHKVDQIPSKNYETLSKLKSKGYDLAILTARTVSESSHLFRKDHPLMQYVSRFYYQQENGFKKPDPRVFDAVLEDYKMDPSAIIYVGDSVGDGIASTKAGIQFIATLESGIRKIEDFGELKIKGFISELEEVFNYL